LRTVLAKAERQDAKAVRIYRDAVPSSELSLSQGEECILSKAEGMVAGSTSSAQNICIDQSITTIVMKRFEKIFRRSFCACSTLGA